MKDEHADHAAMAALYKFDAVRNGIKLCFIDKMNTGHTAISVFQCRNFSRISGVNFISGIHAARTSGTLPKKRDNETVSQKESHSFS